MLLKIMVLHRAWVGNLKQRVPITSKSSKFKGATQHYVVKLPKSAGARHYCPKIQRVPGTLGTRANSSPAFRNKYMIYYIEVLLTESMLWQKCKIKRSKLFKIPVGFSYYSFTRCIIFEFIKVYPIWFTKNKWLVHFASTLCIEGYFFSIRTL